MSNPKCIDLESVTSSAASAALKVIEENVDISNDNGNSPCRLLLLDKLHDVIQTILSQHVSEVYKQNVDSDASADRDAKRDVWNEGLNM